MLEEAEGEAAVPMDAARRIEFIDDRQRFAGIAAAWDSLAARDPGAHVFQGYPWLSTWLKHYPGVRPLVAVVWRGGELTAAIPLCAEEIGWRGLRIRSLRFAADTHSDYCEVLSDPRHPDDLQVLWAELLGRRDWQLIDLRYVPAASRLAALVPASPRALQVLRQHQDIAPYMDVRADWRRSVPRDHRKEVLRRRRRADEQGQVRFEVAETPEDADTMLQDLAAMHIARWHARRETSVFRFENYRAWVHELCGELLARRQLYLCRLLLDDKPISMALGFVSGRRLLRYTSTFDEAYAPLGPVHLLLMAVVDDLRAKDAADVHDFGRGGEAYKARWTQQAQSIERFLIARKTPMGLAAFWWSGYLKASLWRHPRLSRAAREIRRRIALRRVGWESR